jgi:hypothetical protein
VAGCLVNAKSAKQKLVTKDSTEAELVGASDDVGEVIKIRNFMCEQGINMKSATLYQDNMSTIAMIRKGEPSGKRNRHIHREILLSKGQGSTTRYHHQACSY